MVIDVTSEHTLDMPQSKEKKKRVWSYIQKNGLWCFDTRHPLLVCVAATVDVLIKKH